MFSEPLQSWKIFFPQHEHREIQLALNSASIFRTTKSTFFHVNRQLVSDVRYFYLMNAFYTVLSTFMFTVIKPDGWMDENFLVSIRQIKNSIC